MWSFATSIMKREKIKFNFLGKWFDSQAIWFVNINLIWKKDHDESENAANREKAEETNRKNKGGERREEAYRANHNEK